MSRTVDERGRCSDTRLQTDRPVRGGTGRGRELPRTAPRRPIVIVLARTLPERDPSNMCFDGSRGSECSVIHRDQPAATVGDWSDLQATHVPARRATELDLVASDQPALLLRVSSTFQTAMMYDRTTASALFRVR